ncbi:allene oxide cyclase barrel-like domain-containing protein [Streptomyces sp. NBC_01236]|uniref:allene oxide cyclase barrel-like domain-containing protein n=1 Tax=Streptomyces sp. NBC_01236 TaxID=2903789 RepID=UPI002E0D7870|nr:dirigent protein [Streptomyces sp. NBC_01236]
MLRFNALRLGAVAGLATVLTCGSIATAAAATPADSQNGTGEKIIRLVATIRGECTFIDQDNDGEDEPGDQAVCTDDLARDGVNVGHDGRVCTLLRIEPDGSGEEQCEITLSLPKGQITVQGLDEFPAGGTFEYDQAITGGTGEYRAARGYIHVVVSESQADLTIHLLSR